MVMKSIVRRVFMNKKKSIVLSVIIAGTFFSVCCAVVDPKTLKDIKDNVNKIVDEAIMSNDYSYILNEDIPDVETEEELNIVASVINARAQDLGIFNKMKLDNAISKTRNEIQKLAASPVALDRLGQAVQDLSKKR